MARRGRDGFILVSVLGTLALMASLVGGTALVMRASVQGLRGSAQDLALEALVRAGIEVAAYELYELRLPPRRLIGQRLRLDSGTISLTVSDETGRIDLNWSDPVLLAGAYRAAGLSSLAPAEFAARVVQWRDRYEEKKPAGTSLAAPPVGRGKDGFRTVSELRFVPGVSGDDAQALLPFVTVNNVQGKVNVLEAPYEGLLALPEMTSGLATQVIALREGAGPDTAERVKELLRRQQALITTTRSPTFRVRVVAAADASAMRTVEVTLLRGPTKEVPYFVVDGIW